jgi:hypothetical protein
LSRKAALGHQGRSGKVGIGVRGWLDELPLLGMPAVAVFDTRAHTRRKRSSALPRTVERAPGPLEDAELERAEEWGGALANEVLSPAA